MPITTHTGVSVAQTVLVARPFLLNAVGFFITQKAASGDVTVLATKTVGGKPDMNAVLSRVTVAHADLKSGIETIATLPQTLVDGGNLYAIVFITGGGHKMALAGAGYTEGQFYYGQTVSPGQVDWVSTDPNNDIKLNLYTPKFTRTRTEVNLTTVVKAGGIDNLEIRTEQLTPKGTELFFEVRHSGTSGQWRPVSQPDILRTEPDTLELRAVFLGTSDLQPSLRLGAGKVRLRKIGSAILHKSIVRTLGASKTEFQVDLLLSNYDPDDTDQVLAVKMRTGVGYTTVTNPTSSTVTELTGGVIRKSFKFTLGSAATTFVLEISGSRANDSLPYLVTQSAYVAIS